MKHYAITKYHEVELFERTLRTAHRTERNAAASKRGYRRRERSQLKRTTAALVAAELDGCTEAERGYWRGEFETCRRDLDALENAEVTLRERGEWTNDHVRIFAGAYDEIRRRSERCYTEWFNAA